MSLLDKIKEFIARQHNKQRGVEISIGAGQNEIEVHIDHYRTMTDAERAETLEIAANQWEVQHDEDLDYKDSLVDLMKLVGLNSSLKHRQELAREVGWDGDIKDTAAMNEFLYPLVLKRLEIAY